MASKTFPLISLPAGDNSSRPGEKENWETLKGKLKVKYQLRKKLFKQFPEQVSILLSLLSSCFIIFTTSVFVLFVCLFVVVVVDVF